MTQAQKFAAGWLTVLYAAFVVIGWPWSVYFTLAIFLVLSMAVSVMILTEDEGDY